MTKLFLPPGIAVLLVDDDPILLASLELMVAELGAARVATALDVPEAVAELEVAAPTLAIVDWRLGRETAAALIERLAASKTKVVVMSSYIREAVLAPLGSGAAVIEKPFTDSAMRDVIFKLMRD